jgi:thiol-disulfide isomerase/thioredoxin
MRSTALQLALAGLIGVAAPHGCAPGPSRGSVAPPFEAVDAQGAPLTSAMLDGKVTLYYFWATWCAPCVTSSPEIQDIHERYVHEDDVRVIAVHYDGRGNPREYMTQNGYTWKLIPDGGRIVKAFGIKKIPQVVVVGRSGEVVFSQVGFSKGDGAVITRTIEQER